MENIGQGLYMFGFPMLIIISKCVIMFILQFDNQSYKNLCINF